MIANELFSSLYSSIDVSTMEKPTVDQQNTIHFSTHSIDHLLADDDDDQ